jgi:hypothetical protein
MTDRTLGGETIRVGRIAPIFDVAHPR